MLLGVTPDEVRDDRRSTGDLARRPLLRVGDDGLQEATSRGEPIGDESFLLLFNAHYEPVTFQLPARRFGARWKLELSTADPHADESSFAARAPVEVESRSLVVLRRGW